MDGLKRLLRSSKFQAAVVSLVVSLVITLVPGLEPLEAHLDKIVAGFLVYILGTAAEDFASKRAGKAVAAPKKPAAKK